VALSKISKAASVGPPANKHPGGNTEKNPL